MGKKKVYLISSDVNGEKFFKIGYTKRKVSERLKEFKTGNCSDLSIVHVYEANEYAVSIENSFHKYFKSSKIEGEWFSLTESDVNSFLSLCDKFYNMFDNLSKNNTYLADRNVNFK